MMNGENSNKFNNQDDDDDRDGGSLSSFPSNWAVVMTTTRTLSSRVETTTAAATAAAAAAGYYHDGTRWLLLPRRRRQNNNRRRRQRPSSFQLIMISLLVLLIVVTSTVTLVSAGDDDDDDDVVVETDDGGDSVNDIHDNNNTDENDDDEDLAATTTTTTPLQCDLYIATSTIPHAGIGIFSGRAKDVGDKIGNGDKAIPLIDLAWHNGNYYYEDGEHTDFFNPFNDYVWSGTSMGMQLESAENGGITAFWPGVNAMVNGHQGLINAGIAVPTYDEGTLHRDIHPGAGAISPYNAGSTLASRHIPEGGEIFKSYGDHWFLNREHFGAIPVSYDYDDILNLMSKLVWMMGSHGHLPEEMKAPTLYDELIVPVKDIWTKTSRTLNALHDFTWDDIQRAMLENDVGILFQPSSVRSIDWLNTHGWCIDHIVYGLSTIDGAGHGAFAKRDLPEGTVITGTPLLHFPDRNIANMYDMEMIMAPSDPTQPMYGTIERDSGVLEGVPLYRRMLDTVVGQQLFVNYCFGHDESTILLCPDGSGVNYINHADPTKKANVRVQWASSSDVHDAGFLERTPEEMEWVSGAKLILEYVATRDIGEGEELFLDYGPSWQRAWDRHVEDWSIDEKGYLSAFQYNEMYGDDTIVWTASEQEVDPYPENLSIHCHLSVIDDENEWDVIDWTWGAGDVGYPCRVMERQHNGGLNKNEASYMVIVEYSDDEDDGPLIERTVHNVPRQAIRFFDKPYTTDIHLYGAFRHPIGIPDDILPPAWRNRVLSKETESTSSSSASCPNVESDDHDGSDIEPQPGCVM